MGIFRITRAEFVKVFKKPTVYIMAFIMALFIVGAMFIYKPVNKPLSEVSLEGTSPAQYYSTFINSDSATDGKKNIDSTYFNSTIVKFNLYKNLYDQNTTLTDNLNDFKNKFETLYKIYGENKDSEKIELLRTETQTSLNKIVETYEDYSLYKDEFSELSAIVNYTNSSGTAFLSQKYFDSNNYYNFDTIKEKVNDLTSKTTEEYISTISTNKYIDVVANLVNYRTHLLNNILSDALNEIVYIKEQYINNCLIINQTDAIQQTTDNLLNELKERINTFKTSIDKLTSIKYFTIVTTTKNVEFNNNYEYIIEQINSTQNNTDKQSAKIDLATTTLKDALFIKNFEDYLKNINYISPSTSFINTFSEYSEIATKNQSSILEQLEKSQTQTIDEVRAHITDYKLLGQSYYNLLNDMTIDNYIKFNKLSLSEIRDAKNLELKDFNIYSNSQNISQEKFKIKKNTYNVSSVYSMSETSEAKTNMFDFMYYALKIATFLIIIFTIMMIANIITSETESGTIKLLLMRPYRRGTVLVAKVLATFFFSLIFLLLAMLIAGIGGYFIFGLPTSSKLLVTFNASTSFFISHVGLIALQFLSCILDIIFYLILALTIAVLFKSYIGAISLSLILYIGSIVLGAYISNSQVYAYLPFTNTSLFRFFGNELTTASNGILTKLLSTPVQSFQNIWISLATTISFSIILFIITIISFKKRDF